MLRIFRKTFFVFFGTFFALLIAWVVINQFDETLSPEVARVLSEKPPAYSADLLAKINDRTSCADGRLSPATEGVFDELLAAGGMPGPDSKGPVRITCLGLMVKPEILGAYVTSLRQRHRLRELPQFLLSVARSADSSVARSVGLKGLTDALKLGAPAPSELEVFLEEGPDGFISHLANVDKWVVSQFLQLHGQIDLSMTSIEGSTSEPWLIQTVNAALYQPRRTANRYVELLHQQIGQALACKSTDCEGRLPDSHMSLAQWVINPTGNRMLVMVAPAYLSVAARGIRLRFAELRKVSQGAKTTAAN